MTRTSTALLAWAEAGGLLVSVLASPAPAAPPPPEAAGRLARVRIRLAVEAGGRKRSRSPASAGIDFQELLRARGLTATVAEDTIEVLPVRGSERDATATAPGPRPAAGPRRVPHRLDRLFGSPKATLHFVVPDQTCAEFAVAFDAVDAGRVDPPRFPGLVGDGDLFRERFQRREIAASHFDHFADFDGDGDLDLFQGGVEPYVHCHENAGATRLAYRGRLASGGELFHLPASKANRSWVTVAFFDIDRDGDQDFFPSFNDGPDSGRIIFYRNLARERGGGLAFERVMALATVSGVPLAGGAQAGGWFPSIALVRDGDDKADGSVSAFVGSKNRCWLYRGLGTDAAGSPRFADAVAVAAGGAAIDLVNPRFELADADGDGDLDLFAGTQPGPVLFFRNHGSGDAPRFAAGVTVAFAGKYLIGDAHSGVKVADLDGDGLLDLAAGRFWERTDLSRPEAPRDFGGSWRNAGGPEAPRFEKREGFGFHAEGFQPCDAVRQNSVRAVDWDRDGRLDLLAGDTDGFVWFFAAEGERDFTVFAPGRKLRAAGQPLSVAGTGGHARLDACDWDQDGRLDLVVAAGGGTVTLFRNESGGPVPVLEAGRKLEAGGKPIQVGARSSALACDWDGDGKRDLVLADEKGYWFLRDQGSGAEPVLAPPRAIHFGGQPVAYVRPNLGSFVDWDGDGKRDLIGCHFENSVRFYRNLGSGAPGAEPEFADAEGLTILKASSPQMISGADAVDWNGDGDLDILTGQGHGGSGLRFFERDWLEDELAGTHPLVTILGIEMQAKEPR